MVNKNSGNHRSKGSQRIASSPYNFISLPEYIIPAEFYNHLETGVTDKVIKAYKDHVTKADTYSGYIDISATTETPLFIGGTSATSELTDTLEFYGAAGQPVIPGSSIKGMIKQIFKIVTASCFRPYEGGSGLGDFEDRYLYFRYIASSIKSLKKYYNDHMITEERNGKGKLKPTTKARPGFIIKTKSNNYYIVPSKGYKKSYSESRSIEAKKNRPGVDWLDRWVNIHTGKMESKKTYMRIEKPGNFRAVRIPIPLICINSYLDDKNRKTLNLLDDKNGKCDNEARAYTGCDDIDYVVPCYYSEKNGLVEHFGHGRFYRIPYDLKISDHVPHVVSSRNNMVDLCDSVFGFGDYWCGRLAFTDGHFLEEPRMCSSAYPHPLMNPNPTSFQLYLEQDYNSYDHQHWGNKDVAIRGYKVYWHQSLDKSTHWQRSTEENSILGTKKIRPVDIDETFISRIYFNRLSTVELGALLFSVNLDKYADDKQCIYYKLGMGKSIGLGSIKLSTKLTVIDNNERYTGLFSGNAWKTGEKVGSVDELVQAFFRYRNNILGDHLKSYQNMLADLYRMMDWNIANGPQAVKKWDKAVEMMNIKNKIMDDRIRYRTKLSKPEFFIKQWSKQ